MKLNAFCAALIATTSLIGLSAYAQDAEMSVDLKPKAPVSAPHVSEIPTVDTDITEKKQADVNYLTGGIGDDERALIQAAKATYNTHITNASVDGGAFVGDTEIAITNKDGVEILHVNAGPLLYVQLPAGKFTLTATHGEEKKTQTITIGGKKKSGANLVLSWKVATKED